MSASIPGGLERAFGFRSASARFRPRTRVRLQVGLGSGSLWTRKNARSIIITDRTSVRVLRVL